MPLAYYRYISLMNFPIRFSNLCASTIFMIEFKKNGQFWKFWPFHLKYYTKCQISAAKAKKTDAKKQLTFKIATEQCIFNYFWVNCSCLKWLDTAYALEWRPPIFKPFAFLSWKFAGKLFVESSFSWHQNLPLKWLFWQKTVANSYFRKFIFYWYVVNWKKIYYHSYLVHC